MALQSNTDLRLRNGLLPVSSVVWLPFPICNFEFINICLYTAPPSVSDLPLSRFPLGLLLNTFLSLSILLTQPIQFNRLILKNESTSYLLTAALILNHIVFQNFHFLQFPPNNTLKTFLPKADSPVAISIFIVQDSSPLSCHWSY